MSAIPLIQQVQAPDCRFHKGCVLLTSTMGQAIIHERVKH